MALLGPKPPALPPIPLSAVDMVSAIDGWAVSDSGVIVRYTAPAPPTGIHFTAFNQAPPG
ncbi:MAG: hypothetical protein IPO15_18835 [Anaerolineae bacterium]|uniref:hypothetical protein n=1 Tax=Candidatus Amarolinea dominans TaxID=3140696 RepID=UPI003136981F|nr:hypothetical protein [Anaerolineae bacterium]